MTTLIDKVVGVTAEDIFIMSLALNILIFNKKKYVESLGKDFSEALRGDLLSEFGILSSNGIRKNSLF